LCGGDGAHLLEDAEHVEVGAFLDREAERSPSRDYGGRLGVSRHDRPSDSGDHGTDGAAEGLETSGTGATVSGPFTPP
jgi:hypothetical protein